MRQKAQRYDAGDEFASLEFYPNPTNGDVLYVNNSGDFSAIKYTICGVDGKLCGEGMINGDSEVKISLEGLTQGMYIIKWIDMQGKYTGSEKIYISE